MNEPGGNNFLTAVGGREAVTFISRRKAVCGIDTIRVWEEGKVKLGRKPSVP
jgi:hypothetical protein